MNTHLPMNNNLQRSPFIFLTALLFALPSFAHAQTTSTWNGVNGDLNIGSNWSGGAVPRLTDHALFLSEANINPTWTGALSPNIPDFPASPSNVIAIVGDSTNVTSTGSVTLSGLSSTNLAARLYQLTIHSLSGAFTMNGTSAYNLVLGSNNTGYNGTAVFINNSAHTATFSSLVSVSSGNNVTRTWELGGSGNWLFQGAISNTSQTVSVLKTGGGVLEFQNATTQYQGATTIQGGAMIASILANGGSDSSIGRSTNAAANLVLNGGTLRYTGATTSTNRNFTLGTSGGTLEANGTGAVNFTSTGNVTLSGTNTARTLTLTGTNANENILAASLTNNGSGATSLVKDGSGTWRLSGASSTFTGAATVSAGTLIVADNNALGGSSGVVNVSGSSAATLQFTSGVSTGRDIVFSNTNAASRVQPVVASSALFRTGTTGSLSSDLGSVDTTAAFLGGSSTAGTTLNMGFQSLSAASNDNLRISDVFHLTGTGTDIFVLQLQVDPLLLTSNSFLGWNDSGLWVNAINENSAVGSSAVQGWNGSFVSSGASATTAFLGSWGVDTTVGTVWAVLDHNSHFAIIPEPNTSVLLIGAIGIALCLRRRMRKA